MTDDMVGVRFRECINRVSSGSFVPSSPPLNVQNSKPAFTIYTRQSHHLNTPDHPHKVIIYFGYSFLPFVVVVVVVVVIIYLIYFIL